MILTQFNKRWFSPTYIFKHLDRLYNTVGLKTVDSSPLYGRAREARIAAIMAFVITRIRNIPALVRLPKSDPPDCYLMQPRQGTMDITTVEITSYRSSKETLLDQLIRKKLNDKYLSAYSKECVLMVELFTEDKVDYEAINNYCLNKQTTVPIWCLRKVQQTPDTIAEVITINPKIEKFKINVGKEAYYFNETYKIPSSVISKKAFNVGEIKSEIIGEYDIPPWENLED
jgi:hypothetical protein